MRDQSLVFRMGANLMGANIEFHTILPGFSTPLSEIFQFVD